MDGLWDTLATLDASDWAAWVALALSALTLLLGTLRRWRRGRVADPVAWLERHGGSNYCVLTNHGPAEAAQVGVSFAGPDGAPIEFNLSEDWPLPLPRLAAGDVVFLPYLHIPGTIPMVVHAHVRWRDERWKGGPHVVVRATSVRPIVTRPPTTPADLRRMQFELVRREALRAPGQSGSTRGRPAGSETAPALSRVELTRCGRRRTAPDSNQSQPWP